jgi:hypothetical protein
MADDPFEIPHSMRELAETNIKQAHAVYEQLTDFVAKAIDTWMSAIPGSRMGRGFKYAQDRATEIAMENAEAASTFVSQISEARTFHDIVTLETQFVQERMLAFVVQIQQLHDLIGQALQPSDRALTGSNPLIKGSAPVADPLEQMAKKHADSAFALAEKIAKAQTLQDIFTLQTQFAQEQMQAYAAQTVGLQWLIGKAFPKL